MTRLILILVKTVQLGLAIHTHAEKKNRRERAEMKDCLIFSKKIYMKESPLDPRAILFNFFTVILEKADEWRSVGSYGQRHYKRLIYLSTIGHNLNELKLRFRDKYHPDASTERTSQFKDAVKGISLKIYYLQNHII